MPAIPYIVKDARGGVFARSEDYRQVTVEQCYQQGVRIPCNPFPKALGGGVA
jgi:hypothetical protein